MDARDSRLTLRGDALAAFALALLLGAVWAWRDWGALSALHLPDADAMLRLQQVRDWLAGQGFADLRQHRLGAAPGIALQWSRLPDLVPGAIIAGLTPLLGAPLAELVAVIVWPTALFAVALLLVTRIARVLGGSAIARTATVVAAIAFPTTTIFLPGRIDPHGLQIVLLLIVIRALVARPAIEPGLVAGFAAAAGVVVGTETVPLLAAAGAAMAIEWLRARAGADDRMMGFGIGLGAGLLAASIVFRSALWNDAVCDGFTVTVWRAAVIAAFAPMGMALAARDIASPATRAVLGAIIVALIGTGIVLVAPECLAPGGGIDPLLVRLWGVQVGDAQSIFTAPLPTAIGYAGVMVAGVLASGWRLQATRDRRWAALLTVQLAAVLLSGVELRAAYAGAILAAPGLAAVIAAARARGAMTVIGAWFASAGMLYPIAAQALGPTRGGDASAAPGGCTAPATLATLRGLPPGGLLAPLDLGGYAIGATSLRVVGAPYPRNVAGNLAVYRFFLGDPAHAAAIAQGWHVRYVAMCGDSFDTAAGTSLAHALRHGQAPNWLVPIGRRDPAFALYRIDTRLFSERRAL
ncbi:hypothetical protein [Sphingomonas glacialis]|uniref:hypothetical protein n=1 Tax=Sphingomonas glacialis TaxID=658225 RepID=UPI00112CA6BC|nr:hypothetical protein [Sphingomonas glacialis]